MRKTALPLAIVALLLCPSLRGDEPAFEAAGAVPASRYLPADQLSGPEWKVEPQAVNDGLTNTYTVTSRFGSWPARGRLQVAVRGREIQALAELEKVSKTDVFKEAVKKSATAPLELASNVAAKPVETLKGVPQGVSRWVKKTSFQVKETYHDTRSAIDERKEGGGEGNDAETKEKMKQQASSYALDQLKISGAERRWYKELGVDPFTDNEVLRKAVKSVARVEGLTSFGMRFSGLPSIPGAREMRKTLDLVWNTDPWELRLRNRNLLLGAGLSEETVRAFEDNPNLTLSAQTAFLDVLGGLKGVNGREHLLARAIAVESREEAQELVASASLLLRLHQGESPLREILPGPRLPVARTAKGEIAAVFMADAIFWTDEVAGAAQSLAETYAGEIASSRQVYVSGEASSRAKSGAGQLGWEIVDRWQPKGGDT